MLLRTSWFFIRTVAPGFGAGGWSFCFYILHELGNITCPPSCIQEINISIVKALVFMVMRHAIAEEREFRLCAHLSTLPCNSGINIDNSEVMLVWGYKPYWPFIAHIRLNGWDSRKSKQESVPRNLDKLSQVCTEQKTGQAVHFKDPASIKLEAFYLLMLRARMLNTHQTVQRPQSETRHSLNRSYLERSADWQVWRCVPALPDMGKDCP